MRLKIISFYPEIARALESKDAAIFYQQIRFWSDKGSLEGGWIYKPASEIEQETTLTENEQRICRRIVTGKGWIAAEKRMHRGSMTWHYKLLIDTVLIAVPTVKSTVDQLSKSQLQPPKITVVQPPKITVVYTESTTENTQRESTPAQKAKEFFEEPQSRGPIIARIVSMERPEPFVRAQIERFVGYWMEPSRNGMRRRWEDEKYFDIMRRLSTWFLKAKNSDNFRSKFEPPRSPMKPISEMSQGELRRILQG